MGFLIFLGIKINHFSTLDLLGAEGFRVTSLEKNLQPQVHHQAPTQTNVWELSAPSLALKITSLHRHISLTAKTEKPKKSLFRVSKGPDKKEVGKGRDSLCMPACHESTWMGLHCCRWKEMSREGKENRQRTQWPGITLLQIIYSTTVIPVSDSKD